MKKAICFVDDDNEEIHRFREFLQDRYIIGAAVSIDDALDELRNKRVSKPDLFVLDLYYGPEVQDNVRQEIAETDERIQALETHMQGLLARAGQSPEGGFRLAEQARARYPQAPRIFFSRKAFLRDALRAYETGLRILEKPDPDEVDRGTDNPYDSAFRRHADELARFMDRIINLNSWWMRYREWLGAFSLGLFFFLAKVGWDLWKMQSGISLAVVLSLSILALAIAWSGRRR